MSIVIRDVREHELDLVLALNNAAGPGILPMDAGKLRFFWENADYFRVAEKDGLLAGFLVGAVAGCAARQPAISSGSASATRSSSISTASSSPARRRGAGVGRVFYADVQSFAEVRVPAAGVPKCSSRAAAIPPCCSTAASASAKSAST